MSKRRTGLFKTAKGIIALATVFTVNGGIAAVPPTIASPAADQWTYADVADVVAGAPIVARAKIRSSIALKTPSSSGGSRRFYVEATVTALIRSAQAVPPKLVWLVDVEPDSRGKLPRLKNADVIVAARPVDGRPGQIQLVARDAQQLWTPALDARVRAIVAAATARDAPSVITGITSAFHTPGTIIGESETQIFLATALKAPVSITVLARPGQSRQWALALGEIVDESAAPPARDTLGWYRLACFLPPVLPASAIGELASSDDGAAQGAVQSDYRFVIEQLGPCVRTRR